MDELWVDEVRHRGNDSLREAARSYFSGLYEEELKVRPRLDGLDFGRISKAGSQMIEAEFS